MAALELPWEMSEQELATAMRMEVMAPRIGDRVMVQFGQSHRPELATVEYEPGSTWLHRSQRARHYVFARTNHATAGTVSGPGQGPELTWWWWDWPPREED